MATLVPPANVVSSLVNRFEKAPEKTSETRSHLDDPRYPGSRLRSRKIRPPLIRLEFVTTQAVSDSKPVQSKLRLFENQSQSSKREFDSPSHYRKNETGNYARSRTTLERPLLKLKSRFEKNSNVHSSNVHHSLSPMRRSQGTLNVAANEGSLSLSNGPSAQCQSQQLTRSMPDISQDKSDRLLRVPFHRMSSNNENKHFAADFHHAEAFVTRMNRSRPEERVGLARASRVSSSETNAKKSVDAMSVASSSSGRFRKIGLAIVQCEPEFSSNSNYDISSKCVKKPTNSNCDVSSRSAKKLTCGKLTSGATTKMKMANADAAAGDRPSTFFKSFFLFFSFGFVQKRLDEGSDY